MAELLFRRRRRREALAGVVCSWPVDPASRALGRALGGWWRGRVCPLLVERDANQATAKATPVSPLGGFFPVALSLLMSQTETARSGSGCFQMPRPYVGGKSSSLEGGSLPESPLLSCPRSRTETRHRPGGEHSLPEPLQGSVWDKMPVLHALLPGKGSLNCSALRLSPCSV